MADEQDQKALKEARERYTNARASIGDLYGKLDEIIKEYKRDEKLSSLEAFREFRAFCRKRLVEDEDTLRLVLNGSLRNDN